MGEGNDLSKRVSALRFLWKVQSPAISGEAGNANTQDRWEDWSREVKDSFTQGRVGFLTQAV